MKKLIPFILVALIAVAAFLGLQHFTGNTTTAAETIKEEISLPDLTVENTSVQEVAPTPAPAVVSAPTEDPQLMYVMKDSATGKIFYQADSEEVVLKRIRESITAEEAVNAVECVEYGAMMVVSHDDERIIDGITAYDLISDEDALKVSFNRNSSKLFVCEEGQEFQPSEKSDKTFKGLADKKAYASWICSEHTAFKASALLYEGYPKAEGYRGPFAVADGFSAKVLKSVRLIHTEGNRYDWVLVSCDCKEEVPADKKPSGGNGGGGGSKPTQQPTQAPTQVPTQAPTQNPTQEPAHAPAATLPPKPTQEPAHAPAATLPPKPTKEPVVTSAPELGAPSHAQEDKLPEKKSETTSESESAHANEQKAPEKKTETSSEVKSSETALPPKKGTVSASSNEPAPALGGVTF